MRGDEQLKRRAGLEPGALSIQSDEEPDAFTGLYGLDSVRRKHGSERGRPCLVE